MGSIEKATERTEKEELEQRVRVFWSFLEIVEREHAYANIYRGVVELE